MRALAADRLSISGAGAMRALPEEIATPMPLHGHALPHGIEVFQVHVGRDRSTRSGHWKQTVPRVYHHAVTVVWRGPARRGPLRRRRPHSGSLWRGPHTAPVRCRENRPHEEDLPPVDQSLEKMREAHSYTYGETHGDASQSKVTTSLPAAKTLAVLDPSASFASHWCTCCSAPLGLRPPKTTLRPCAASRRLPQCTKSPTPRAQSFSGPGCARPLRSQRRELKHPAAPSRRPPMSMASTPPPRFSLC